MTYSDAQLEEEIDRVACDAYNREAIRPLDENLRRATKRRIAAEMEVEKLKARFSKWRKSVEHKYEEVDQLKSLVRDRNRTYEAHKAHAEQLTLNANVDNVFRFKTAANGQKIIDANQLDYPNSNENSTNLAYDGLRSAAARLSEAILNLTDGRKQIDEIKRDTDAWIDKLAEARRVYREAAEAERKASWARLQFVPKKCKPKEPVGTDTSVDPDLLKLLEELDPEIGDDGTCTLPGKNPGSSGETLPNAPPGMENLTVEEVLEFINTIERSILEALQSNANTKASGDQASSGGTSRGACSWNPVEICARIGRQYQECINIMQSARQACQSDNSGGTVAQCKAACTARGSLANDGLSIRALVIDHVNSVGRKKSDLSNLQKELELATATRESYEQNLENRVIHIYTNSQTGALVKHDGPKFEPRPPLVYTGNMAAPPLLGQIAKLDRLRNLEKQAATKLEEAERRSKIDHHAQWRDAAVNVWQNASGKGPDTCRAPAAVNKALASCKAICDAQGISGGFAQAMDVCRQNSNPFGMLTRPGVERWLHPCHD